MGGVCYRKGMERGLWYELKCQEDIIASPTASQKDKAFARQLLKSYKKFTEKDYASRSE